jgi:hypothetical protein
MAAFQSQMLWLIHRYREQARSYRGGAWSLIAA